MTSLKPAAIFGVLTGGKAGTLLAAGATQKVSAAVNTAAEKLGAKIGEYTGGNVFSSLAKGAQRVDSSQADTLVQEQTGYSLTDISSGAIVLVVGVVIYFLFRSKAA